jgi:hypothetical protein
VGRWKLALGRRPESSARRGRGALKKEHPTDCSPLPLPLRWRGGGAGSRPWATARRAARGGGGGCWEPDCIFYKGTSHDLNPFVYLLLAYPHDVLDKMLE